MSLPDDPRSKANLLLVEIGNSHVSIATAVAGQIYTNIRFNPDERDLALKAAAEAWEALPPAQWRAIAAASVVPRVLEQFREPLAERLGSPVLVVGDDLHRPMSLAVEAPETVGIDRVCSAAAAYETLQHACVIASFGTAITIDCVNDEGAFMGGAILPGLDMQAWSLNQRTAQLPKIAIDSPQGVYGGSTDEAIRHGIVFGVVGALREITERYATELKSWPDLIACGGNAELISRHSDIVDRVVPDLCLRGIAVAYRRHFSPLQEVDDDA